MPTQDFFSEFAPDPTIPEDEEFEEFVNLFSELERLESPGFVVERPQMSGFEERLETVGQESRVGGDPWFAGRSADFASGVVQLGRGLMEQLGIDIGDTEEEVQLGPGGIGPEAGAEPLDVTDPTVVLSEQAFANLSPAQKKLRLMRRFVKSTERGTLVAPMLKGEPVTDVGAQAQGILAPPASTEEGVVSFIGENFVGGLVPGVAAFKPAQLAGRALLGTSVGRQVVGRTASKLAGAQGGIAGRLGQLATKEASEEASEVALRQGVSRLGADVFGETTSGGALGAGYAARALTETGQDVDLSTIALGSILGGGAGAILGTGFRAFDIRDMRRSAKALDDLARDANVELPIGTRIDVDESTARVLSHYDDKGNPRWRDPETNQFASAPPDEVLQRHTVRIVGEAMENAKKKGPPPDAEARLAKLDQSTEENIRRVQESQAPDDLKQKEIQRIRQMREQMAERIRSGADVDAAVQGAKQSIQEPLSGSPEQLQESLAGIARSAGIESAEDADRLLKEAVFVQSNYEDTAKGLHSRMPRDAYNRQIEILRAKARDPSPEVSRGERVEALGRALAMEDVARVRDPRTEANRFDQNPGIEMTARRLAKMDDTTFENYAAELAGRDDANRDVLGRRIVERARELRNNPEEVARAQTEIRDFVNTEAQRFNRGTAAGSKVVLTDRNNIVATLLEDPQVGFAQAQLPGGEQVRVDMENAQVLPQAGQLASLSDGSTVRVRQISDDQTITVEKASGERQTISPADVERVGANPDDMASLREAWKEEGGPTFDADRAVQPIRPIETTIKETGERVEVVSVTDKMAQVKNLTTGEVDEVRLDQLAGGSRQTEGFLTEGGEIPTFEPGTLPSEGGRNINYLELTHEQANTLEAMLQAGVDDIGRLLTEGLQQPASLYLFPQTPKPGTKLYAIELPSEARNPTQAAKKALGVLAGNVDVDKFNAQTLRARMRFDPSVPLNRETTRIYQVPEGLRQKVREPGILNSLDANERVEYLKRLTDLGFEVDSKQSRLVGEAAAAREAAADALRRGDVELASRLEVETAEKASRAGMRTQEVDENIMQQQLDNMIEDLRGRMTPESQEMLEAMDAGDEEAFLAALRRHPATDQGAPPTDPIVLSHQEHPGLRLIVHKERIPTYRRTGAEELPEKFENMSPEQISELGNLQEGFRDVYHLETIASDGTPLRSQTIGSEMRAVSVPRSAEESTQAAVERAIAEGRPVDDIIREAEQTRGQVEAGDFEGSRVEILEETSATEQVGQETVERQIATVRDAQGREFQIDADQIKNRRTIQEPDTEIRIPRRLSEDEILREVWLKAKKFNRDRVEFYSAGEWRHSIPGVYATVRPHGDGVRMRIFQEARRPTSLRDKRSKVVFEEDFSSADEAHKFLRGSEGFRRQTPKARDSEIDGVSAKLLDVMEDLETREARMQAAEERALADVLGEEPTPEALRRTGGVEGREDELEEALLKALADEGVVKADGEPYARVSDARGALTRMEQRANSLAEDLGLSPEEVNSLRYGEGKIETVPKEKFSKLPTVESLTQDQMFSIERELMDIIGTYRSLHNGWIPSPVRDYAARFSRRWNAMGLPIHSPKGRVQPFNSSIRRSIGTMYADGSLLMDPSTGKPIMDAHGRPRGSLSDVVRSGKYGGPARTVRPAATPDLDVRSTTGGVEIVPNQPSAPAAPDLQPMEGVLLNHMRPGESDVSTEVLEMYKAVENNRRFYDIRQSFSSRPDEILTKNLARVGDDQRLAVITDPNVGGPDAEVMFVEGSDLHFERMDKADITRIRDPNLRNDFKRMVDQATFRERQTPGSQERGFGEVEKQLGLTGIADDEIFDARFVEAIKDVRSRIKVGDDGNLIADPDDVDRLVDLYVRAREIGTKVPIDDVGGPLRDVLDRMGIERTADEYGPDNPFGVFVGKVKMGKITPKQRELLKDHARRFGLNVLDLPDWRVAEELVKRAYDPITARRLWQWRNDLGYLRLTESDNLPVEIGTITFRNIQGPGAGDIGPWAQMFEFPRSMARRHPTFDMAYQRHAQLIIEENNANREVLSRFSELQRTYGDKEMRQIRDLMEDERLIDIMDHPADTPTWSQVKEAIPDADDGLRHGFEEVRDIVTGMLRKEKTIIMRKGWELRRVDPHDPDDMKLMGQEYGVSQEQWQAMKDGEVEAPMIVDRKLSAENRRSPDEIREMHDLLDEYSAASEIPDQVKQDLPDWMVEEFDFFKNFGINNYWPRIQQGRNVIVRVAEDGSEELIGFAPSGVEAQRLVQRAIKEGRLEGGEFQVRLRGGFFDDLDMHYLGPKRLRKVMRLAGDNAGDVLKAAGLTGEPIAPRLPHTEMRSANLTSLIDDPIRELQIYVSRINRNKYLMDVHDVYQEALDMDSELSRAYGLEMLQDHRNLFKEFQYQRDRAMGEQSDLEKMLDHMVAWGTSLQAKGGKLLNMVQAKLGDADANFNMMDQNEAFQIYRNQYGARSLAQRTVAVQAVLRLGVNPAAAAVNMSQYLMTTWPKLVDQMGSTEAATKATIGGLNDLIHYWRNVTNRSLLQADTERGRELVRFSEQLGLSTVTNRAEAGGKGVGVLDGSRRPVGYVDDTVLETTEKWAKWAGMWLFDKAERFNRLSTAFASRRAAREMGIEEGAQQVFARRLMEETQFQYYDEALPRIMRGPLGRVMMQFKPFVANMLKFNKDLLMRASKGDKDAAKALMAHAGMGTALGGAAFIADNPVTAPLNVALDAFSLPNIPEMMMGDAAKEHAADRPESWDHPMWQMDNLVNHGLPGLLGIAVGGRLGVGGQDIDPRRWQDVLLGPHFSVYHQYAKALGTFAQRTGGGPAAAAGTLGGVAIGQKIPVLKHLPFGTIMSSIIGTSAASQLTHNPFMQFLEDNIEGQRFANEISPTMARGIDFTVEMFFDGELFNMLGNDLPSGQYMQGGSVQKIPPGPSRLHESTAALMGFMTSRKANENALVGAWTSDQTRQRLTRQDALEGMARALLEGNLEKMYEIQAKARERGVLIEEDDILRSATEMEKPRLQRQLERFLTRQQAEVMDVGPRVEE